MATKTKKSKVGASSELKYVDTAAFISLLDRSDHYHPLFSALFAYEDNLITTPLVIAEGQGWFLRRFDSHRALQFMHFIESLSILKIVPVSSKETQAGNLMLRKYSDQKLTLVDAVGLALMQREKIKTCWSTDRHMTLAGARLAIHL